MKKVKISRDTISVTSPINSILDKLGKEEILVDLGEYTEVSIRPLGWVMEEFKHSCGQSYKQFQKNMEDISDALVEIYGSIEVGTAGNCVFNLFFDFMDEISLVKDRNGNVFQKKVSNNLWQKKWNHYIKFIEKNPKLRLYSKPIEDVA